MVCKYCDNLDGSEIITLSCNNHEMCVRCYSNLLIASKCVRCPECEVVIFEREESEAVNELIFMEIFKAIMMKHNPINNIGIDPRIAIAKQARAERIAKEALENPTKRSRKN